MFARSVGGRILRNCSCAARRTPATPTFRAIARRRFTSSTIPTQDAALSPATHPLAGVASQLDQVAPRFEIDPSEIEILDSPTAFYETLKVPILDRKLLDKEMVC
jgi:CDP-diacylglycerol--glycerol-3-phosphate 3-phosphatidyltransferase